MCLLAFNFGETMTTVANAIKDGEMPPVRFTNRQFESVAKRYLEESDSSNCLLRADTISVMLLDDDRGLLRHHRNCLNTATEVC